MSASISAPAQLTAEEYLNLPDTPGRQELLDGELISLPPAQHNHSQVARAFQEILETVLNESRVRLYEGYQLKRGWLIPDVSATWPNQTVSKWFQGAPTIAIEVLSPEDSAQQIDCKIGAYLQEGSAEVWVVYPETRSMMVFRKDQTLRVTDNYHCELIGVVVKLDDLLAGV